MENEPGSLTHKLSKFLMAYRTAPHALTNETPAKLFLNRDLRTKLSLIQPDHEDLVTSKNEKIVETHGGRANKVIDIGQKVLCKNFAKGGKPWVNGKVISRPGTLTYVVQIGPNKFAKRHVDQLIMVSDLGETTDMVSDLGETSNHVVNGDLNSEGEIPFGPTWKTNALVGRETGNNAVDVVTMDNTALQGPPNNTTPSVINSPSQAENIINAGVDSTSLEPRTNSSQEPNETASRRYPTRSRNMPTKLKDYDMTEQSDSD